MEVASTASASNHGVILTFVFMYHTSSLLCHPSPDLILWLFFWLWPFWLVVFTLPKLIFNPFFQCSYPFISSFSLSSRVSNCFVVHNSQVFIFIQTFSTFLESVMMFNLTHLKKNHLTATFTNQNQENSTSCGMFANSLSIWKIVLIRAT